MGAWEIDIRKRGHTHYIDIECKGIGSVWGLPLSHPSYTMHWSMVRHCVVWYIKRVYYSRRSNSLMWITLSFPPQLSVKLFVTSKRTIATSLLTSRRKWRTSHLPHPSQGTTSSRAERSSPSAPSGSALQSVSSSLPSSAWNSRASTRSPTTPSRIATSISARTYTPTPSYQGVPPCSQDSPKGCRRRSPLLFHPRWKWRSSLLQGGSTLCGLEDPSWPAIVPSRGCGSANRNMTSLVLRLFTGSVCKCQHFTFYGWLWDTCPFVTSARFLFHFMWESELKKKSRQDVRS